MTSQKVGGAGKVEPSLLTYNFTHSHAFYGLHNIILTLIAYFSSLSSLSLAGEHCALTLVSLMRKTQNKVGYEFVILGSSMEVVSIFVTSL